MVVLVVPMFAVRCVVAVLVRSVVVEAGPVMGEVGLGEVGLVAEVVQVAVAVLAVVG